MYAFRTIFAGAFCKLPHLVHEFHRHALEGTPGGESSGIHRLALAWGHPAAPFHHIAERFDR